MSFPSDAVAVKGHSTWGDAQLARHQNTIRVAGQPQNALRNAIASSIGVPLAPFFRPAEEKGSPLIMMGARMSCRI